MQCITLILTYILENDVSKVTSVVHGIVLGVPIPFALPNPDGCVDSGLICPLKAGGPYTYITTLPVEKKYPKVKKILNQNIPIQIVIPFLLIQLRNLLI